MYHKNIHAFILNKRFVPNIVNWGADANVYQSSLADFCDPSRKS